MCPFPRKLCICSRFPFPVDAATGTTVIYSSKTLQREKETISAQPQGQGHPSVYFRFRQDCLSLVYCKEFSPPDLNILTIKILSRTVNMVFAPRLGPKKSPFEIGSTQQHGGQVSIKHSSCRKFCISSDISGARGRNIISCVHPVTFFLTK